MNIFVTGATGVLGKLVTRLLVEAGHQVYAMSRSQNNMTSIQQLGAKPIISDIFDCDSLSKALASIQTDAIIHLATKIPPTSKMGKLSSWQENDHIRRDGTRNLINAALATKVQTVIYPSFYYVYPDCGDRWIDALSTPVQSHPIQQATIDAETEVTRFTTEHRRGIVLRMGSLYGPDAPSALEQVSMARKGFAALPGPRDAYLSYIWTEDAARAIIVALTEAPAGIYDIVDDEPLTREEFATALAQSVDKRRLLFIPKSIMNLLAGSAADMTNRSQRVSNRRFRELTTWKPTVASAQKGWKLITQADHTKGGTHTYA